MVFHKSSYEKEEFRVVVYVVVVNGAVVDPVVVE